MRQGARLVVAPEMAVTGYVWQTQAELRPHAEAADGPTAAAVGRLTQLYRAWAVVGIAERAANGTLYNSAIVVGPDGAVAACYRKVLLFELDETWARPGAHRMVLSGPGGKMVPGICMDLNDPGHTAWVRDSGAAVHAFCTNWLDEGLPILGYWQHRLRGFAGVTIAANTWGIEQGVAFRGESAIFRATGPALAIAHTTGDAVLLAEVDLTDAG